MSISSKELSHLSSLIQISLYQDLKATYKNCLVTKGAEPGDMATLDPLKPQLFLKCQVHFIQDVQDIEEKMA